MPPPRPGLVRIPATGSLKRFSEAQKNTTRLLGDIQRYCLSQPIEDEDRDLTHLHVSEVCKSNWCPRSSYYRLAKIEPDTVVERVAFQIETNWEEGRDIEAKWKRWVDQLGRLRGVWKCLWCEHRWSDTSPPNCPKCGMPHEGLVYKEVPMFAEDLDLIGNADGDIDEGNKDRSDDPVLEIKSIGEGTLRIEQAKLLTKHTHVWVDEDGDEHRFVDLRGAWRDIRRPFPSHLRQGVTYGLILGRKTVVFIYEYKPTQQAKEFVVKVDKSIVADMMDQILDVRWALKKNVPPDRPLWASNPEHTTCKVCPFKGTCWSTTPVNGATNAGHHLRAESEGSGGTENTRQRRPGIATEAEGRYSPGSSAPNRLGRQLGDGPVRSADPVDGLHQRPAGTGPDRGTVRRVIR